MKIKVLKEFLGIPVGSIGVVTQEETNSIYVKFDCKTDTVLVGNPDSHFTIIKEE